MATNALSIIPVLRPLRQAGIRHILFNNISVDDILEEKETVSFEDSTDLHENGTSTVKELKKRSINTLSNDTEVLSISRGDNAVIKQDDLEILPLESWPESWKTCFFNAPKSPRILWSYEELGQDLSGDPNYKHKDLLQQLLKDMSLPKGSHAFWPLQMFPNTTTPEENARIFISGIKLISPEWVVFMTGAAPKILGLSNLCSFVPEVVWGRYVLLAPHIDDIYQNKNRYGQLISFLKIRFFN